MKSLKVLVILTSTNVIEGTGHKTGFYLPEVAHPLKQMFDAGFNNVDFLTPRGGKSPMDPGSVEPFKDDEVCQWFLNDVTAQDLISNTKTPAQIASSDYKAVLIPGGHGPMFDLATDENIAKITADIHSKGGIVAAGCHGPAGLLPVFLSNGQHLLKDKKVTSFTDTEENAIGMAGLVPFSLMGKLKDCGAVHCSMSDFHPFVMTDDRILTSQNAASSELFADSFVKHLQELL